jgi:hypothetical protein
MNFLKVMGRRRTPYRVIQRHHISYDPPQTVLLFRVEHRILTWLDRIKKSKCSTIFLNRLADFLYLKAMEEQYNQREMGELLKQNQRRRLERRRKR